MRARDAAPAPGGGAREARGRRRPTTRCGWPGCGSTRGRRSPRRCCSTRRARRVLAGDPDLERAARGARGGGRRRARRDAAARPRARRPQALRRGRGDARARRGRRGRPPEGDRLPRAARRGALLGPQPPAGRARPARACAGVVGRPGVGATAAAAAARLRRGDRRRRAHAHRGAGGGGARPVDPAQDASAGSRSRCSSRAARARRPASPGACSRRSRCAATATRWRSASGG